MNTNSNLSKKSNIEVRLTKLRKSLYKKEIECALITKPQNVFYLSGFNGSTAVLLITSSKAYLLTDFRYIEQAKSQASFYDVIDYKDSTYDVLNQVIDENRIKTIGIEEDYTSVKKYSDYIKNIKIDKIIMLEGMVEKLREIKDAKEIELIKKAAKISDAAFGHILKFMKPKITEMDIAIELEYFMKKNGASSASFDIIVASGKRSALPHGVASRKEIEFGDSITLDFGSKYEGYCSDMTRTVFIGNPQKEIKTIYNIVLEAQEKALLYVKNGLTGIEIDKVGRTIIQDHLYGNNFGHGLGHGIGIDVHESPRLSPSAKDRVKNSMVVTVEPGIYVEDLGGVRIEDMVLIKGDTPVILTKSSKEIVII